ncbi:MAG: hypothetical protein QM786_09850 [Breznakibacter sp.]
MTIEALLDRFGAMNVTGKGMIPAIRLAYPSELSSVFLRKNNNCSGNGKFSPILNEFITEGQLGIMMPFHWGFHTKYESTKEVINAGLSQDFIVQPLGNIGSHSSGTGLPISTAKN